ncbi:MAG TPA: hypothetical protein VNK04_13065 [Gemmataceae bacterium]|jgi:hypothetical protein|nr:hypothetical protein [Gemmataceae bacterium]
MSPLRRVFGERAGPQALGILVPPGRRTVLILRPRALAWDLLLIQPGAAAEPFRELERSEAEAAAEQLCRALEEWAGGGPGRVEAVPLPGGGHCVRADVGAFPLIACLRRPGQPYRPMVFANADEAHAAATAIAAVLCPAAGRVQEVYFNTRHFRRGTLSAEDR